MKIKNKGASPRHTRAGLPPARGRGAQGRDRRSGPALRPPPPPPGPGSLTVRGGALRARAPRRRRRRSPSRPGCPPRVRRAHALLPAPSALYRAAPREEEIDLSLPELFATRPFNPPRPGRPRPQPPWGRPTVAAGRWDRRCAGGVAGPGTRPGGGGGVQSRVACGGRVCSARSRRWAGSGGVAARRRRGYRASCELSCAPLAELAPARPRVAGSGPGPLTRRRCRHRGCPGPGPGAPRASPPAPCTSRDENPGPRGLQTSSFRVVGVFFEVLKKRSFQWLGGRGGGIVLVLSHFGKRKR